MLAAPRPARDTRGSGDWIRSLVAVPACVLVWQAFVACRSVSRLPPPARFIVTGEPLGLFDGRHPGICVAVDPDDPKGVWWWEPGPSGCSTRSTGPDVMAAGDASVVRSADTS